MNGWLIYTYTEAERNEVYINDYFDVCKKKNVSLKLLYTEKLSFGIKNNKNYIAYEGEILEKPDFAICRAPFTLLTEQMEKMKIPVFNSSKISRIANDKRQTHMYLSNHGIKTVDTKYFDRDFMLLSDEYTYPAVVKSAVGHGGKDVFLARDFNELKSIVKKMPSNKILIQKCAKDVGKDLRVYVIGKKIVVSILRQSDTDFRSNFSLGGKASLYMLDEKQRKTVEKIISLFDFGFVGIDFIFDDGKMLFNEIEDVVGSRMIYNLTDIKIVETYIDFILDKLK